MMHVIITSYNEPKSTVRAVQTFLNQLGKDDKITVVDPFEEAEKYIMNEIKDKRVDFFLDPGEGKAYALNLLFQDFGSGKKDDLWILSDGDVYVSDNAIKEITSAFKDKKIGCVTGKPVALDEKKSIYEYWSWVAFAGVDKARKRLSQAKKFLECSGYLFAIRQGVIYDFPMGTSEDSIIPYLFWKKGYGIKYVDKAEVYVKNPNNWKDYSNQKVRNIKAHENLNNIAKDMPRTKTLFNEIKEGLFFAPSKARNLKELLWVLAFYPARLWIYIKAFIELKKGSKYGDGWRETEIESTKPMD